MLQLRIAPAPAIRIVSNIIALFVAPFARIKRCSVKFILPNEIHAFYDRVVWRADGNVIMIGYIRTWSIWITDKGIVDVIVADTSAGLSI
ncbi:hypothetical protein D3C78_1658210 [compost metagenome]